MALVIVAGLGTLGLMVARLDTAAVRSAPVVFWLFAGLALIGELFPITLPREHDVEEIGTSTTFGFAVLLSFGTGASAIVFATATVLADVVYRKPPFKVIFNVAQYTMSVAAGGGVYHALGGDGTVTVGSLGPVAVAGIVMFLVNDLLTGVGLALSRGERIVRYLLSDLWFQASTALALFAMSPVVVVVSERSPFLVPLLAVPVVAAYWGATTSLENSSLVSRLESALEQEKELSRLKDDFVAVVSHELRTPLTSIQGYVKTLLQLGTDLGEEQHRSFLEAADRQGDRLRRLIEQLLTVARLESNVEPLSPAPVSLPELARAVIEEVGPAIQGHTFDLLFDEALPLPVTDEEKVRHILSNLVENALKYSPPDTRVTIRGRQEDDGVVVSVQDEGRGIPAEAHERVFDRFFQVDGSSTRAVGGIGLGLYICKEMSLALGARLRLDMSTSEGSTFSLWLPLRPDPAVREEPATPVAAVGA